jgi:hypothetical protein
MLGDLPGVPGKRAKSIRHAGFSRYFPGHPPDAAGRPGLIRPGRRRPYWAGGSLMPAWAHGRVNPTTVPSPGAAALVP